MLTSETLVQGIDPYTGQVAFGLALVDRPGRNGLRTVLNAAYSSAVLRTATTWNQQAPTGALGLGWSVELDRVWVEPGPSALRADREVHLRLGGLRSRLARTGTAADGSWTYGCENGVFWQISYDPVRETWRVVDENAVTYLFGDALSGRGTVDWGVAWGGWAGPSGQRAGQGAVAVGWSLSAVTDRFGDRVAYAYLQDGSTVGAGGTGYTQATYLASITGVDGATVRLTYQPKDAAEYQDPHTDPPPPNAWQDRFETRFLARVDTVSATGGTLESLVFGYAQVPLGSGTLTKRLLASITRLEGSGAQVEPPLLFSYWGQQTSDGVTPSQPFHAANGALYGAIRQATLAYGGTVAWSYAAPTLQYSARSLAVASTTTATEPRLYFADDDYVLATWQDGAATLRLQAYVWSGRWVRTDLAQLALPSGVSYADVQVGWGNCCCAVLAGKSLLLAARDIFNPGGWLPTSTFTVALADGEEATLAVGRDFACVLGGTGGTIYPYRLTGATWTADATYSAGAAGSGFALAARGALAVAVATGASGGATGVTLLLRGTDGTWTRTTTSVDLGGLAGATTLAMGAGFAVARAAQPVSGMQTVRYGALWWDGTATSAQGAPWLAASIPSGSIPAAPQIQGATVGLMGRLYRYDGAAWSTFDPATVAEPGATGLVSATLGADLYARLFSTSTGQAADLLAYAPLGGGWSVPAGLAAAGAAPLAAVAPRTADGAVGSYAAVGTTLWHRAADGTWSAALALPTGLSAADMATLTVLDDSVLLVQQGTGGNSPATLAYPLQNGGAASAAVSLGGQQFTPGAGLPVLVGTTAFATFTGAYGAAGSTLTLYRALRGNVQGTQTGYAVASVTSDNQYGSITGSGAVPRAVACNGTGATVDETGYLPRFNQATVAPGAASTATTPDGSIVYGYYNGLVTGEAPAQPFPAGTYTNALDYAAAAEGLAFLVLTRDAAGATAASSSIYWQVTAGALGQAGRTAYSRDVRREDLLDGVTTLSTTTFRTDTGLPAAVGTQVANAAGGVDAFAAQFTYWWEIYDTSRTTNFIAPVVQTTRTSTPAGGTETTVAVMVQTWRGDWGYGAGRWAPDRTFRALGASAPAFDAWQPSDPAPSGWLMDGRVQATTPHGLTLAAADALGRLSSTTYDTSLTWSVASVGNCPADPTLFAWFGCEPYEQTGAWGTADPSRSLWSFVTTADYHTGSQCLALPPGTTAAAGPLLAVTPSDQAREYVFSCWARTPAGFAPASGVAQWTLEPFDPASGQAVGQPIALVMTPASGTPTAVGGWEYFQATVNLPALVAASGKPALGLRIAAANANTAQPVYLDELRFMPLDASLQVQVYDVPRWRPQAVVDSAGQSRQARYDPSGRPLVAIGPYDRVDGLEAWGYSRLLSSTGAFLASFPNTHLQLSTTGGSRYYDFHDGNTADWTFSGSGWTITNGELSYTGSGGAGIGATATLSAYAYTYFAAGVRVASTPSAGQSLSLGNGDVYMQWVQGTGWKLVRVSGNTVTTLQTNASLPFGRQWTFAAIDGWILCFVDATQLFAYQVTLPSPLPAGYGSVRLATSAAAAWDDVVLLDSPQLRLDCLDGLGVVQQTLDFVGVQPSSSSPYPGDAVVLASGPLLDGLGRPAGERLALQAPVQMSTPPGGTGWELVQAGEADYLRTAGGTALTMPQYLAGTGGYTYAGTTYETSPLSRVTASVAPRPQGSDAALYTTALAYGGSATVGGDPVTAGAKYRVAAATRVQGTDGEGTAHRVTRRITRDALGRVLMDQDGPAGGTLRQTGYEYDAAGYLSTIYRPNYYAPPQGSTADAWKETLSHDFLGRLTSWAATDSGTTQRMYDSEGRLRFGLDATGAALTPPRILYWKYDGLDRLTESGYIQDARYGWNATLQGKADTAAFPVVVATPSGPNDATGAWGRRIAWDTDGVVSTRFLVGQVASISINQNGDPATPDVERYQYDAYGNPVEKTVVMPGVSPTAGWTVTATYNGQDAPASLTYPALDDHAPQVVMGYDRTGRLATVGTGAGEGPIVDPSDPPTPPEQRWARYAYDAFGRVSGISYNNPLTSEDGPAVARAYGYDGAQRLAGIADPYFVEALAYEGGTGIGGWSYYDGSVAQAQSGYLPGPRWSPAIRGMTQRFQYDGHGRLASAVNTLGDAFSVAPGSAVTYDANGNVRGTAHGRTQVSYAFGGTGGQATNRLASATSTVNAPVDFNALPPSTASSSGWTWGSSNGGPSTTALVPTSSGPTPQVTQVLRLGGGGLGHYEALQLPTYLQPGATYTVSWQAKTDTGYGEAIGLAAWYAVLAVESGPSVAVVLQTLAASSTWQSGTLTVDPSALAQSQGGGLPVVGVAVELRNQGRNADGSSGPSIYLAQAGVTGSVTGGTYQYDGDGSVTAAPDRGLSSLAYDPVTRLTTSMTLAGGASQGFAYGGDGRRSRASLTSGGSTTTTVTLTGFDGEVLATRDSAGGAASYYLNGPEGTFGMLSAERLRLLLGDHLGSLRLAVDGPTGNVVSAGDYQPYGGGQRRTAPTGTDFAFTDQRLDATTGLYDYNARLYDPALGRFYAVDAAGEYASPYLYVGNDPVANVDPEGTLTWRAWALYGGGFANGLLAGTMMSWMSLVPMGVLAVMIPALWGRLRRQPRGEVVSTVARLTAVQAAGAMVGYSTADVAVIPDSLRAATPGSGPAGSAGSSNALAGWTPLSGGSVNATVPSAAGTTPVCRVEVGATHIGAPGTLFSSLPIWHLLVIYTNAAGEEHYYRGGPGNTCVAAGPHYGIRGDFGRYVSGTVDYPAVHRTAVLEGPAACGMDVCFQKELQRIHNACTPYNPFGPNSNTVARTLLEKCGVPQKRPVFIAPAWGQPAL